MAGPNTKYNQKHQRMNTELPIHQRTALNMFINSNIDLGLFYSMRFHLMLKLCAVGLYKSVVLTEPFITLEVQRNDSFYR